MSELIAEILGARGLGSWKRNVFIYIVAFVFFILPMGIINSVKRNALAEEINTPTATAVKKAAVVNTPTPVPTKVRLTAIRVAKMSHYWPDLGGVNCATFINGSCVSTMSNGEQWQTGINTALACPVEFPFGTEFILPGGEKFTCKDRGGAIVTTPDNKIWLDLLVQNPPVPFGTEITVTVIYPENY